jgi:cytochrome c peroxidase
MAIAHSIIAFFVIFQQIALAANENYSKEEPIQPLPSHKPADLGKVRLGQLLFHDPRLSHDNTVSCASCHNLRSGGADNHPKAIGIGGAVGEINTLTVFNSGHNFVLFWDGRATNLAEQLDGPIHNKKEMASSWPEVAGKLRADPIYRARFQESYNGQISEETIKDALVSFEKALDTPDSRFDLFLRGDVGAITQRELLGYRKFKSYGCIACHQGVNVGGNMYQVLGVARNYFADLQRKETFADQGRYNVTHQESDRHVFRVPSLRNVELTSPYFHDASATTLEEAVSTMARYQLGRTIPDSDIALIVEFLKTLTGKLDPALIGPPDDLHGKGAAK